MSFRETEFSPAWYCSLQMTSRRHLVSGKWAASMPSRWRTSRITSPDGAFSANSSVVSKFSIGRDYVVWSSYDSSPTSFANPAPSNDMQTIVVQPDGVSLKSEYTVAELSRQDKRGSHVF